MDTAVIVVIVIVALLLLALGKRALRLGFLQLRRGRLPLPLALGGSRAGLDAAMLRTGGRAPARHHECQCQQRDDCQHDEDDEHGVHVRGATRIVCAEPRRVALRT